MTSRGFSFKPIDIYRSDATSLSLMELHLIPPFSAMSGIGENAAKILQLLKNEGDFLSIEDFQNSSKASKTVIELLSAIGLLPRFA